MRGRTGELELSEAEFHTYIPCVEHKDGTYSTLASQCAYTVCGAYSGRRAAPLLRGKSFTRLCENLEQRRSVGLS